MASCSNVSICSCDLLTTIELSSSLLRFIPASSLHPAVILLYLSFHILALAFSSPYCLLFVFLTTQSGTKVRKSLGKQLGRTQGAALTPGLTAAHQLHLCVSCHYLCLCAVWCRGANGTLLLCTCIKYELVQFPDVPIDLK